MKKKSKNYKIVKFKSRDERLSQGRKFGGSSAAAILGISHWARQIDVWSNFFNKKVDNSQTESTIYGTKAEEHIREIARLNFKPWGWEIEAPKKRVIEMAIRKDKPYMTATLDGTIVVKENGLNPYNYKGKGILEIKTHDVKGKMDLENWDNQIPIEYESQITHYLAVYNDYEFAVLVAKLRFFKEINEMWALEKEEIRYYFYDRNSLAIDLVEQKETEFYNKFIIGQNIPKF